MTSFLELDHPYALARALSPWARSLLSQATAVPGRLGGFGFIGTRAEMELASRTRYDAVKALPKDDPLKPSLLRWVHRLTEMRVNQLWLKQDDRLLREELHPVREPEEGAFSIQSMKRASLCRDGALGSAWQRGVLCAAPLLLAHRVEYFARCREVHERLGEQDVRAFWSPVTTAAPVGSCLASVRGRVRELLGECEIPYWQSALQAAQGHELDEGWPARLGASTMAQLLAAPEFFRGVALSPGPLPARLVPASFARAGYQLGRALFLGWTPADRPLVALRDPDDWGGHRLGFLLLLWLHSAAFDHKTLGLSASRVRARRRGAVRTLLAQWLLQVLRTAVHERAIERGWTDADLEEVGRDWFEQPLPLGSAFVMLGVRRDEPARLSAWLDAAATYQEYVDTFDEDFIRDPRAREKIRAEAADTAPLCTTPERLTQGLNWLLGAIDAGLG